MTKYLLGIDVGTTSLKVALIDENAKLIGIKSGKYKIIVSHQNYVQIDSKTMWDAFILCLRKLKEESKIDLKKVVGISISSLCPGLIALDESNKVIVEPIIYSDRRSTEEAEIIKNSIGAETLFSITANGSMAGAFSGSTMLWIKRHLPDEYRKTKCFGHLNTFFANRLTGALAIDYSNASYTNLFETTGGKKWSRILCDKIGIDSEKLPQLHESTDIVGNLVNEEVINLDIPAQTPVVIGGADTPCASLAAGVVKNGDVCESVGTTDVLTVCVDKPVFDKGFINRCHVVPGTWIYQGAMSFAGAANEWFLKTFCQDILKNTKSSSEAFAQMNREAAMARPGCDGVVFLPYMLGERSPIWDPYARSVFFGISLQTTRKEMSRAILEGGAYGLRQLTKIAEKMLGSKITEFVSIGGAAKSEVWAQIKADVIGVNLKILDMNEMAPVGAALLAGVGTGIFKDVYEASAKVEKKIYKEVRSNNSHEDVYSKRYQVYTNLYPALKDIYKQNAL
jgi:xylulokinase